MIKIQFKNTDIEQSVVVDKLLGFSYKKTFTLIFLKLYCKYHSIFIKIEPNDFNTFAILQKINELDDYLNDLETNKTHSIDFSDLNIDYDIIRNG